MINDYSIIYLNKLQSLSVIKYNFNLSLDEFKMHI